MRNNLSEVTQKSKSSMDLGLVDITLKAHYKLGRDKELKELSKKEDIFAVPKGSALVCDNKTYRLSMAFTYFVMVRGKSSVKRRTFETLKHYSPLVSFLLHSALGRYSTFLCRSL